MKNGQTVWAVFPNHATIMIPAPPIIEATYIGKPSHFDLTDGNGNTVKAVVTFMLNGFTYNWTVPIRQIHRTRSNAERFLFVELLRIGMPCTED